MVLAYRGSKQEDVLILDNQRPDVMPIQERPDLIAAYIFQDKGDGSDKVRLVIIKDEGDGQRSLKSRKENHMFKKWVGVKERSRKNIEDLISFNEGRPLVPDWAVNSQCLTIKFS